MATTRILLCFLCLAFTGSYSMFSSNLLAGHIAKQQIDMELEAKYRIRLIGLAQGEIGVREKTNHNDGKRVEAYLALVDLHRGDPYCAAFISFIYAKAGLPRPRSGWCPDLFPASRLTKLPLPGDVFGIYFPELKRIAHVGMVESIDDKWCITIEANTNQSGSREGEGVYRKRRLLKTICKLSNWVHQKRRGV